MLNLLNNQNNNVDELVLMEISIKNLYKNIFVSWKISFTWKILLLICLCFWKFVNQSINNFRKNLKVSWHQSAFYIEIERNGQLKTMKNKI